MSKFIKIAVGISVFALCLSAFDSSFAGTWKQNAAKSKVGDSGLRTDATLRTEVTGDQLPAEIQLPGETRRHARDRDRLACQYGPRQQSRREAVHRHAGFQ